MKDVPKEKSEALRAMDTKDKMIAKLEAKASRIAEEHAKLVSRLQEQNVEASKLSDEHGQLVLQLREEVAEEKKVEDITKDKFVLEETITTLKLIIGMCYMYASRCADKIKKIISSVGAWTKNITYKDGEIIEALKRLVEYMGKFGEVIEAYGDYYALASVHGLLVSWRKRGAPTSKPLLTLTLTLKSMISNLLLERPLM